MPQPAYQRRVIRDHYDMNRKLGRLRIFLAGPNVETLDPQELERMRQEADLRQKLCAVLKARIENFKEQAGVAHNGDKEAVVDILLCGTREQLVNFAMRIHDERWVKMLHRRVGVEQLMLDAANGKRPMPTPEELRAWALKLGGQQ
jgi:hypothetical protein